ncbi:MAG: hypothetical protein J6T42_00425 [Clostridia bacterium]|nr:hypothetical protein [Clostridia bacterium]
MDWVEDVPFIVKLLLCIPVVNAFTWGIYRIENCFDLGEWYHKIFSLVLFVAGFTPVSFIDAFWLIFVDHDVPLIADPY